MFNIKTAVVSAFTGFVLSFFISVIFTHKFFTAFFRGIVFAAVFAVLSFLIEFLNTRFLKVTADSSEGENSSGNKAPQKVGSVVNITIDDENLTEDESAPAFDISANRNLFSTFNNRKTVPENSESDDSGSENAVSSIDQNSGISSPALKPEIETEKVEKKSVNDTPSETKNDYSDRKNPPAADNRMAAVQDIDSLPDIGVFEENSDNAGDSGGVIDDSEFARSGDMDSVVSFHHDDTEMAAGHDTKVIASAIRTLLKKDEM